MIRPRLIRRSLLRSAVLAVIAALGLAGCDTSVAPIGPNDQYYSMYALLDPGADTQFVRVEALRDSMQLGSPPTIDATVTLERVDDGADTSSLPRRVQLTDSFTTVSANTPVHLFWTALELQPSATYELRVERSDGKTSTARTTMPGRKPTMELDNEPLLPCLEAVNEGVPNFVVNVTDIERLAGAYVIYPVYDQLVRRTNSEDIVLDQDTFRVTVGHVDDLVAIGGMENVLDVGGCPLRANFNADSILIAAATAGPDWPPAEDIDSLSIDALARPDRVSNVTNGTGFVAGIWTDTLYAPINWD